MNICLIIFKKMSLEEEEGLQKIEQIIIIKTPKTNKNPHKRPMCHVALLRKQFKSINTYDYIITKKEKNFLSFSILVLPLNELDYSSPKDALSKVWLKLPLWFWRRRWKCEKYGQTYGQTDRQATDDR